MRLAMITAGIFFGILITKQELKEHDFKNDKSIFIHYAITY